ncbi:MAG: hypothetical protein ACOZAN_00030 [Patescibacteria group bacterium]
MSKFPELLASFNVTNGLAAIKNDWQTALEKSGGRVMGTENTTRNTDCGGQVAQCYPEEQSIIPIKQINLSQPNGFVAGIDELVIASMATNNLTVFCRQLRFIREISNRAFNDLHSVTKTSRGYLVTSTGTDCIVELDAAGNTIWSLWFHQFPEYSKTPQGNSRQLDTLANHNLEDYPTVKQTTHVNSAIAIGNNGKPEKYVLATLFHQGQLVRIDRETNKIEVLLEGLKCPHAIREYENCFTLCDSKNNRVLILNKDFSIRKIISGDYSWVQDAFINKEGSILVIADSNNHRIVYRDLNTEEESAIAYSNEWRIFQIEEYAH